MPVPFLVRRVVVAPLVVGAELALMLASPLLAAAAWLASFVVGGHRPLRVLAVVLAYAAGHLFGVAGCLLLWASGRGAELEPHYEVMRGFVGTIASTALRVARVKVTVRDSQAAEAVLAARERPVVVLSIHSGEGDSLLVLDHLLRRHRRRPRVVMHRMLALDPLIDMLGNRLPNRFVDPRGGDIEREIAEMSRGLGPEDAVLIFPEGGNFTEERRLKSIQRLLHRGHHHQARMAEGMHHISAPRPGGAMAALSSAPDADVIFFAHAGFPEGIGEVWRTIPGPTNVEIELWHVPAAEIPVGQQARIDWLFGWWTRLDTWVGERRSPAAR